MTIYEDFNKLVTKYTYCEDAVKRILRIFEGTGDHQIITNEILPSQFKIKDFIVLSEEIDRALNIVHSELRKIQEEQISKSASLFYFTQYGGSKTQFLNLVVDEINQKISNAITILFEDIHHINPLIIFESIFSQTFRIISKLSQFSDNPSEYKKFSTDLRQYISEVQVSIRQSSNLKEAEVLIEKLRKIKNPEMQKHIGDLDVLLHSTILVDSVKILNGIINLMKFCSQNNIIFVFLFDEVDLWLDDTGDDLRFSKEFNQIANIMKLIFEIPDNQIKSFMIFACTDRVNKMFQTMQHIFESRSPVASRLNRIYNASEKISEPGNYGSKINKAFVNLSAYFHLSNNRFKIDSNFLEQSLPILEQKYASLSRRISNSKIIQILKNYEALAQPLENGLKNWKSNTQYYGTLIQTHISSILNRLTIKFIRKDIPVDPSPTPLTKDKIDGYFVNYALDNREINTHAEIKVTSEFKKDKAYQALQFLQLHPNEAIIMIIFCPMPLESIKKEINQYAEKNGYDISILKRIYYILIEKAIAFVSINGISNVTSDGEKLAEFLDAFANWLEFFGDFSIQYRNIMQTLGISSRTIPKKPLVDITPGELPPEKPPEIQLTSDEQTCLNLLSQLYAKHKFSKTGRMNKNTIQNFIAENSLGIMDLEKFFLLMKEVQIIENITTNQVMFKIKLVNTTSLDELSQQVINCFQKGKENSKNLTPFI